MSVGHIRTWCFRNADEGSGTIVRKAKNCVAIFQSGGGGVAAAAPQSHGGRLAEYGGAHVRAAAAACKDGSRISGCKAPYNGKRGLGWFSVQMAAGTRVDLVQLYIFRPFVAHGNQMGESLPPYEVWLGNAFGDSGSGATRCGDTERAEPSADALCQPLYHAPPRGRAASRT